MHLNQFKRTAVGLAVAAAALAAGSANAAYVMSLDVTGIESRDELGVAGNETRFLDLFGGARIIGLAWDVTLSTTSPSWLSEVSVDLNDGGSAGVSLSPGVGDNSSGTASYAGMEDLVASGNDFTLSASGRLFFEFFESFKDLPGAPDGMWSRGTLTVTYVPEPASFGLAAIALLGLAAVSRRRPQ